MHTGQKHLTTNTARLAHRCLVNSDLRVTGQLNVPLVFDFLEEPERIPLLLYPTADSIELTPEYVQSLANPVSLIVPDGSWSHTQRFVRRNRELSKIAHVRIPQGPPTEYHLREQRNDSSVCTLEAIARSLGVIDGPEVQAQMELVLRVMVERTLWSRGELKADKCTISGIPAAARNHLSTEPTRGPRR